MITVSELIKELCRFQKEHPDWNPDVGIYNDTELGDGLYDCSLVIDDLCIYLTHEKKIKD